MYQWNDISSNELLQKKAIEYLQQQVYKALMIPEYIIDYREDKIMSNKLYDARTLCVSNDMCSSIAAYGTMSTIGVGTISASPSYEIKIDKKRCFKRYDVPGSYIYLDNDGVLKQTYIKYVLFRNPATIVFWGDGTKTVCKTDVKDKYNPEAGLSMCILKKIAGATELKDLFDNWVPVGADYDSGAEVRVDLRTLIKKFSKKKKEAKKNSK